MRKLLLILLLFPLFSFGQHHMMHTLAGQDAGGTTLKTDLISVWEFNETSGTDVFDAFASNDGVNTGTATVNQTGVTNLTPAYDFDGTNDYIDINAKVVSSFPMSFSCWFKMDITSIQTVICTNNSANYGGIWVGFDNTRIVVQYGDGTGLDAADRRSYDYNTTLSTGTWYNLVVTATDYTSANTKVYINTSEISFSSGSGTATSVDWSIGESLLCSNWANATNWRFNGILDQTGLWSKILSSDEVSTLYNSGNGLAYVNW